MITLFFVIQFINFSSIKGPNLPISPRSSFLFIIIAHSLRASILYLRLLHKIKPIILSTKLLSRSSKSSRKSIKNINCQRLLRPPLLVIVRNPLPGQIVISEIASFYGFYTTKNLGHNNMQIFLYPRGSAKIFCCIFPSDSKASYGFSDFGRGGFAVQPYFPGYNEYFLKRTGKFN